MMKHAIMIVGAVIAAVVAWALILWTPNTKKQWIWAGVGVAYIAIYCFVVIRK
jgi:uncharacterized membrane protein YfcA